MILTRGRILAARCVNGKAVNDPIHPGFAESAGGFGDFLNSRCTAPIPQTGNVMNFSDFGGFLLWFAYFHGLC
ncbi:MAG: hypothetical protein LBI31_01535, partial [Zoogloeaceae bacterium]|nr:hypothetical protein [Zoogloeaceae bacterium]